MSGKNSNTPTYACSGGVSWAYKKLFKRQAPFEFCCDEHDLAYEENGLPWQKYKADWRFYKCIKGTGRGVKALVCFLAVSTFFGWCAWFAWTYKVLKDRRWLK